MAEHTRPRGRACSHRVYQLDCNAYDRLVDHAGGRCQICGSIPAQTKHGFLVIDHDATVGQWAVRGLLCSDCNTALPAGSAPAWAAGYLAAPWWRLELDRLGLSAEENPEPPMGAEVRIMGRRVWRRTERGWRHVARYHNASARSWSSLNRHFGPHNIRLIEGAE